MQHSPLDLSKVAELKSVWLRHSLCRSDQSCRALLPDVINFAYIPSAQLRIHEDSIRGVTKNHKDSSSADFSLPPSTLEDNPSSVGLSVEDEDEHVLVLDFHDTSKGKKTANPG